MAHRLLAGAPDGCEAMNGQARDQEHKRKQGVRRTLWVTGAIAVALFLLSILSMLKIG
jgi:hypothetical protein